MPISPLRFKSTINTHSVKAGDGARTIVARDTARARKFLAGIQPHGPKAFKTSELGVRSKRGGSAKLARDAQAQAADPADSIDVTDASLFAPLSLPTPWF
jgi:hypothetical protein